MRLLVGLVNQLSTFDRETGGLFNLTVRSASGVDLAFGSFAASGLNAITPGAITYAPFVASSSAVGATGVTVRLNASFTNQFVNQQGGGLFSVAFPSQFGVRANSSACTARVFSTNTSADTLVCALNMVTRTFQITHTKATPYSAKTVELNVTGVSNAADNRTIAPFQVSLFVSDGGAVALVDQSDALLSYQATILAAISGVNVTRNSSLLWDSTVQVTFALTPSVAVDVGGRVVIGLANIGQLVFGTGTSLVCASGSGAALTCARSANNELLVDGACATAQSCPAGAPLVVSVTQGLQNIGTIRASSPSDTIQITTTSANLSCASNFVSQSVNVTPPIQIGQLSVQNLTSTSALAFADTVLTLTLRNQQNIAVSANNLTITFSANQFRQGTAPLAVTVNGTARTFQVSYLANTTADNIVQQIVVNALCMAGTQSQTYCVAGSVFTIQLTGLANYYYEFAPSTSKLDLAVTQLSSTGAVQTTDSASVLKSAFLASVSQNAFLSVAVLKQ